jgi:hypothetical protein
MAGPVSIALGVAALGGTAYSIYSQKKRAEAEEAAARRQAELRRKQAEELLKRFELNRAVLEQEAELFKSEQETELSSRGVSGGFGTALLLIENTNLKLQEQIEIESREAQWKANQIMAGAGADVALAGDIRRTGRRERVATGIRGGTQALDFFRGAMGGDDA